MTSCFVTSLSPKKAWTTLMIFVVKVPVLSEQIVVAFPMVSQAASFRTKLLSSYILLIEYANETVTASGRPSGTATTIIVTETTMFCKAVFQWPSFQKSRIKHHVV